MRKSGNLRIEVLANKNVASDGTVRKGIFGTSGVQKSPLWEMFSNTSGQRPFSPAYISASTLTLKFVNDPRTVGHRFPVLKRVNSDAFGIVNDTGLNERKREARL